MTDPVMTHDDDCCSQRHEQIGTEIIYDHLENHQDGPIQVAVHAHDRNMSINKYIREKKWMLSTRMTRGLQPNHV